MNNIRRKLGQIDVHPPTKSSPAAASSRRDEAAVDRDRSTARSISLWFCLGMGAFGLASRLVWLQVIDAANLQQKAQAQQSVTVRPFVPRRPIVDRDNNQMAIDRPTYTVYAHPVQFREIAAVKRVGKHKIDNGAKKVPIAEMAARIAPILVSARATVSQSNVASERTTLLAKFQQRQTGVLLGRGLRQDVVARLRALKVDGLDIRQGADDYTRYYPQDDLAAEVLGYVGAQRQAQAGVEQSQSALIEREVPAYQLTRTARGTILPDKVTPDLLHTDDLSLKLTIDLRLQRAARAALQQKMIEWQAEKGTVIVMEAETGAIRALVVSPTYDPNHYGRDVAKAGLGITRNWAVADLYEPGSTFKPISVAIALENGIITPHSTFFDRGAIEVGTDTIRNANLEANGTIDVAQVLQRSSNVAMVQMMQRLQPNIFYNWLQRVGLGQKSGIDLPAEATGHLVDRYHFVHTPISPANTAFGQGISLTPVQLTTLICSIANGGKLVKPYVVEGLVDGDGIRRDKPTRAEPSQLFAPKNAKAVLEMMETVVTDGSGVKAKIDGYHIAGKTGTSQIAANGGYGNGKITSFVGILPVNAERHYVVFAALADPKKPGEKAYGSNVATPIVKSVMESLITIERIPPNKPINPQPPSEIDLDLE